MTSSRPSRLSEPTDALPVMLAGVVALTLAPGVLAGLAAGAWLRNRGLRWTWPLAVTPLLVPLGLRAETGVVSRAREAAAHPTLATVLSAGWLPWLLTVPVVAAFWMLSRSRRDRLHGGHAERRAVAAQGPVQAARVRLAARAAGRDGLLSAAGILLGSDETGRPVRVARPQAHVTIVGASGSGKTTTAKVLLSAQAAAGGAIVVLDGKGGHDLPGHLAALGARHDRPVVLWSPTPYGDPALDALRVAWNPCADGSATEVKDRIASAEPQTEPYYAAIASRGLQAAATALTATGQELRLDRIAGLLEQPTTLRVLLKQSDVPSAHADRAWLEGLSDGERSALRGIATRLATMTHSDAGEWLLPDRPTVGLADAICARSLVCFSLPQGAYPELVSHVGRYLLAALNAIAGTLEREGAPSDCLVLVDELSALDGDALTAGLERGRSAGLRYVLATQSLSNFETSGGPRLAAAALDNAELVIIHRQAVPQAAEILAGLAGTEEAWEHTHKVADTSGARIGSDEPGERARRLTDRFRAHPNTIKALRCGEAVLIETRPAHRVTRLRVRAIDAGHGR